MRIKFSQRYEVLSIKFKRHSISFQQSFAKELAIWAKLDHINIVKFEGYIVEHGYPSVVSSWANGGTVTEYVRKNSNCDLLLIVSNISISKLL